MWSVCFSVGKEWVFWKLEEHLFPSLRGKSAEISQLLRPTVNEVQISQYFLENPGRTYKPLPKSHRACLIQKVCAYVTDRRIKCI